MWTQNHCLYIDIFVQVNLDYATLRNLVNRVIRGDWLRLPKGKINIRHKKVFSTFSGFVYDEKSSKSSSLRKKDYTNASGI